MIKIDLTSALAEIFDNGMRAWAKGITGTINGKPFGLYLVKYKSTLHENTRGEWN